MILKVLVILKGINFFNKKCTLVRFPSVVRWSTWCAWRRWIFEWGKAPAYAPARDSHVTFYFFELHALLAIRCTTKSQPLPCGTRIPLPHSQPRIVEWGPLHHRTLRDHSHLPYLFPLRRFRALHRLHRMRWVSPLLLLFFWTPSLGWVARPSLPASL
jgi:hypothetical protein